MADPVEITEKVLNAFLQAAHEAGAGAYISGGHGRLEVNDDQARAGLAAALAAGGYRSEAGVLRESARRWLQLAVDGDGLKTWLKAHGLGLDAGPAGVLAAAGRDLLAYSTKVGPLEPVGTLTVAEEPERTPPTVNCYCGGPEEIYPHKYGTRYHCKRKVALGSSDT